eukprot:s1206_g12.t1
MEQLAFGVRPPGSACTHFTGIRRRLWLRSWRLHRTIPLRRGVIGCCSICTYRHEKRRFRGNREARSDLIAAPVLETILIVLVAAPVPQTILIVLGQALLSMGFASKLLDAIFRQIVWHSKVEGRCGSCKWQGTFQFDRFALRVRVSHLPSDL